MKLPNIKLNIPFYGQTFEVQSQWNVYDKDGSLCLDFWCSDGPFATVSICLTNVEVSSWREAPDEILVKSWGDVNPKINLQLRDSEWFTDTGRMVLVRGTTYIAEVWKVKDLEFNIGDKI